MEERGEYVQDWPIVLRWTTVRASSIVKGRLTCLIFALPFFGEVGALTGLAAGGLVF